MVWCSSLETVDWSLQKFGGEGVKLIKYVHYGSLSDMFTLLHSSMNQDLFEKYICNQSSCYEKYDGTSYPSYHLKLKYPLSFSVSCVQFITQQHESRTV